METKRVWVSYEKGNNSGLPRAIYAMEETARRVGGHPFRPVDLVKIDGDWYVPVSAVRIIQPSAEDVQGAERKRLVRESIKKLKAAGLVDEEINALIKSAIADKEK